MRRLLFLTATVATLAACGPAIDPLPAATVGNPGATARAPVRGPQRPEVETSFPLDYAALPHLVATPMAPGDFDASITMRRASGVVEQARVSNDLLVEIEIAGVRAFTADPVAKDPKTPDGPVPGCSPRPGTAPVSWEGFSLATWTDLFIDYVRYEGTFDFETCRAKPTRFAKVRAPALVPGVAYGFRTCSPVCNEAPAVAAEEELLVIIAPPSRWIGATVPWPKMQTEPHTGLFSRIIVPLKRGGSASAFLHVSQSEVAAFQARRKTKAVRDAELPKAPLVQLGFDFSWLESDPYPVGVGFLGTVQNQPTSGIFFDDDTVDFAERLSLH